MSKDTIRLSLGALAEPLTAQLRTQGCFLESGDADHLQADADAITRLVIRGYMTEAASRRARRRLVERVAERVVYAHQLAEMPK